ncbi:MAG: hypothetical protein L3J08_08190 [Flavobacteriaceae bacterium]|nr:hypothetical protein [Flavobacteriaceae bacterium]
MIKKIVVFTFLVISTYSFAQSTSTSPYSFFGIGDQEKIKSVEEFSMGLMGGTMDSEYQLSFTNPASYGALRLTTYALSLGNRVNRIDDGLNKQASSTVSLNYLALGFPIKENQGLAMGLQLNSAVGYSLLGEIYDNDILIESNLLSGDGGTNRVFLGYGYKLPHNISLGIEVAYIFGGIDNSILNRRLNVELATKYQTKSHVKGLSYKLGAQYNKDISTNLRLKLGTTFELGYNLNEKGDQRLFSLDNTNRETVIPREILSANDFEATIKYPLKTILSAGVGQENKWFVGTEYSFQDAITFNGGIYNNNTAYNYIDSNVISFGGFYIPKYNSISNYWQRIIYRAGFNYKKLGLVIDNTQINDYGMSFGVSLPMGLQLSNINFGFEIGRRGTTDNNLVEENYYNFKLSLSLNDKWFKKRTIN